MIETLGAIALLLVVLGLLVVLVRRMKSTRCVVVGEEIRIGGSAEAVDAALFTALNSVEGARLLNPARGRYVVVLRRTPTWVVIPLLLMFPVGLVFLVIKEDVPLDIALYDGPEGAVLRLTGRSEQHILEALRTAVSALPVT